MKNLSFILNGILVIAVGILYYLHFSSGHQAVKTGPGYSLPASGGTTVAYIVEDTLMNHYEFFTDVQDQLNKKQQTMTAAYQSRAQSLQTEIDNYRKKAPTLAPRDAQYIEEQLTQKQQNLYQYQQSLSQEMLQEQDRINDQLYTHVASFLKDFAAVKGCQVILTLKRGSGMLYGADGLDITNEVIDGLNAKYKIEKNSASNKFLLPDSTGRKK